MLACTWPSKCLKPRANGRNIFGQQLPTLLDVTCCVRLYTLLHVVGCCCAKFETGQTFQPTTPNISFVPWSPKRSVTMLDLFAQLFPTLLGPCSHARQLHIVSSPRCTAGPKIWELLHLYTIAHTEGSNNSLLRPFARNVSRLQKFFRQIQLVFANTPYES